MVRGKQRERKKKEEKNGVKGKRKKKKKERSEAIGAPPSKKRKEKNVYFRLNALARHASAPRWRFRGAGRSAAFSLVPRASRRREKKCDGEQTAGMTLGVAFCRRQCLFFHRTPLSQSRRSLNLFLSFSLSLSILAYLFPWPALFLGRGGLDDLRDRVREHEQREHRQGEHRKERRRALLRACVVGVHREAAEEKKRRGEAIEQERKKNFQVFFVLSVLLLDQERCI